MFVTDYDFYTGLPIRRTVRVEQDKVKDMNANNGTVQEPEPNEIPETPPELEPEQELEHEPQLQVQHQGICFELQNV